MLAQFRLAPVLFVADILGDAVAEKRLTERRWKNPLARCAGSADDPPAMRGYQRVDGAAQIAQRAMRAALVHSRKPAEADDIGV
jgi:hypothetical protein